MFVYLERGAVEELVEFGHVGQVDGRLDEQKGHDRLVQAGARLSDDEHGLGQEDADDGRQTLVLLVQRVLEQVDEIGDGALEVGATVYENNQTNEMIYLCSV